ncbi:MAG: hypothetical protein VYD70_02675 [Planctomycetota bacterium]|nr:hypothetical protein [Planctomycetota bacterium]MEE2882606.1 hypothetical protein [Planctomycetota bacterium]|tara:strand:+ start:544 stop:984 length:441 start_codon:yes stop_codon:yes gene_type:complete
MGSTWVHLLVVHIPVLLCPVALFFLIRAIRSSAVADSKIGHVFVLICAIATVIAYFTGTSSAEWLDGIIQLDQEQVENHGLWGRISFTIMAIAGVAALMTLIAYLQEEEPHPLLLRIVLGLTLIGFTSSVWTAHLGGILRRPELGF